MNFTVARIDHQPLVIWLIDEDFHELFPSPLVAPTDEAAMRVTPRPQIWRQVPPRRTGAHDPKDRVDEEAIVLGYTAPTALTSR